MLNPEAPEFFSMNSLFPLNYHQFLPYPPFNPTSPTIFSPFLSHFSGFNAFEISPSVSVYSNFCFSYVGLPLYYGWETPSPPPPPPPLPLPPSLCAATATQPTVPLLVHAQTKVRAPEAETSTATKVNRVYWNLSIRDDESKGNKIWVPKSRSKEKSSSRNVIQEAKEQKKEAADSIRFGDFKTTVMIKNIPNRYTEMLLELLDKHCMEENKKVKLDRPREDIEDFSSAFDFVYLPMDFRSGCNLGYAFVNFTDARAIWRLHRALHKQRWEILGSKKICEITYAKIQGKAALLKNFENSKFFCESDEFLPISFIPHRSGPSGWTPGSVGKRINVEDPKNPWKSYIDRIIFGLKAIR